MDSIGIVELFMFLYKGHHISRLAAAKTFIDPFGRIYIKRRRFFAVERAVPNVVDAPFFQAYKLTDHIYNVGTVHHFLYGGFFDHFVRR